MYKNKINLRYIYVCFTNQEEGKYKVTTLSLKGKYYTCKLDYQYRKGVRYRHCHQAKLIYTLIYNITRILRKYCKAGKSCTN